MSKHMWSVLAVLLLCARQLPGVAAVSRHLIRVTATNHASDECAPFRAETRSCGKLWLALCEVQQLPEALHSSG